MASRVSDLPLSETKADLAQFSVALGAYVLDPLPEACRELIHDRADELHVTIRSSRAAFQAVPWELLPVPGSEDLLSLRAASFVRSTEGDPLAPRPARDFTQLRLLYVLTRSDDLGEVPYDCVARPIMEAGAAARGALPIDILRPPTFAALQAQLASAAARGQPYQAVHFDCHGSSGRRGDRQGTYLHLLGTDGLGDRVPVEVVVAACADAGVHLLTLNCCEAVRLDPSVEADSVIQHVAGAFAGNVVAMSYKVAPEVAGDFYRAFYDRLVAGDSDVTAANHARRIIARTSRRDQFAPEALIPVVYAERPRRLAAAPHEHGARPSLAPDTAAPALLHHPVAGPGLILALEQTISRGVPTCLSLRGVGFDTAVTAIDWWLSAGQKGSRPHAELITVPRLNEHMLNQLLDATEKAARTAIAHIWLSGDAKWLAPLSESPQTRIVDCRGLLADVIALGDDFNAVLQGYHVALEVISDELARSAGPALIILDHLLVRFFPLASASIAGVDSIHDQSHEARWDTLLARLDDIVPLGAWLSASFASGTVSSPQIAGVAGLTGISTMVPKLSREQWADVFRLAGYVGLLDQLSDDLFVLSARGERFLTEATSASIDPDRARAAGRTAFLNYYEFLHRAAEQDAAARTFFQRAGPLLAPGAEQQLEYLQSIGDTGGARAISSFLFAVRRMSGVPAISARTEQSLRKAMAGIRCFPEAGELAALQISEALNSASELIGQDNIVAAIERMRWLTEALDHQDTHPALQQAYASAANHELGIALMRFGERREAHHYLVKSLEFELAADDQLNIAKSCFELSNFEQSGLEMEAAVDWMAKALVAVEKSGDAEGILNVRADYGWMLIATGRATDAIDNAIALLTLAQSMRAPHREVQGLIQLANCHIDQPDKARDWLARAGRLVGALNTPDRVYDARFNMGVQYLLIEEWALAHDIFIDLHAEAQADGDFGKWFSSGNELAHALRGLGQGDAGVALMRTIEQEGERRNDLIALIPTRLGLIEHQRRLGDWIGAAQTLGRLLSREFPTGRVPLSFHANIQSSWHALRDHGVAPLVMAALASLPLSDRKQVEDFLVIGDIGSPA